MWRQEDGQITVFLACIFLIFLGLSLCVLEGMYIFMESSLMEDSMKGAGNYVLAGYSRNLFERYHLFFLDPRQEDIIEQEGKRYLAENPAKTSLFSFTCNRLEVIEKKTAVDEEGLYLKHQIREWMKYREITKAGKTLEKLVASFSDIKKANTMAKEDMQEAQTHIEEKEQKPVQAEQLPDKKEERPNPQMEENRIRWKEIKEMLTNITQAGILLYVTDDVGNLSKLSISTEHLPSERQKSENMMTDFFTSAFSFLKVEEWKKMLSDMQVEQWDSKVLADELYLMEYTMENFGSYIYSANESSALEYEIEYLIAGNSSDVENLKTMANRMLCLRFLVNYMYLSQNAEWEAASSGIAAALTGILGFPQAKKAVQILLTAAVTFGESILDVHALFAGEKVPIIKDASTWNLTFTNAVSLLKEKGPVKQGKLNAGYEDYLKLFLIARMEKNQLLFRMMDVMQMNIALEEPGFLMENCLFSFCWEADVFCKGWFHYFPGVRQKRNGEFMMTLQRVNSY